MVSNKLVMAHLLMCKSLKVSLHLSLSADHQRYSQAPGPYAQAARSENSNVEKGLTPQYFSNVGDREMHVVSLLHCDSLTQVNFGVREEVRRTKGQLGPLSSCGGRHTSTE